MNPVVSSSGSAPFPDADSPAPSSRTARKKKQGIIGVAMNGFEHASGWIQRSSAL